MDLILKKINKGFYQILNKNKNGSTNLLKYNLSDVFIPFGLENYKGKYLLNFELTYNNNKEFLDIVNNIEENILKDLFKKRNLKKLIKESNNKKICKGNIKKNKNKILTKFFNNNRELSLFEFKSKNIKVDLSIEISGFWVYKDNYGLFINITQIII